ncbi:hypothetical protein [Halobaculum rubrum]|uniref:hypothetical protein n=1 Tax=Halobaculum rubrum TaxID=2872158 RepID=UPI001CA38B96|nr:hypothetical protein [Halobaculum rubrum]QZX98521.1 hypothetical protein K6T25_09520 [Halobaculum rubrum]
MNAKKLLAVALATLLVGAGVGAAATSTGTGATVAATDASVDEYETDAAYDNGTVTLAVTANGSGVEGLSMLRNDTLVGTTDADGAVAFDVNASDTEEVELDVTGENVSGEIVLAFENGSVTVAEAEFEAETDEEEENETDENETDENETDRRGPAIGLPADASDNAKDVLSAVNAFLSGETNASTLGEAVSAAAGNGPDGERGPPADVGPDGDDENETDDDRRGPPEDVGPNDDDDENETDDDDRRGPPEDVGPNDDDDDEEEDEDDEDDEEEDDEDDDDDARGNNGNGNGNDR